MSCVVVFYVACLSTYGTNPLIYDRSKDEIRSELKRIMSPN